MNYPYIAPTIFLTLFGRIAIKTQVAKAGALQVPRSLCEAL
jgi:hypothetical protein